MLASNATKEEVLRYAKGKVGNSPLLARLIELLDSEEQNFHESVERIVKCPCCEATLDVTLDVAKNCYGLRL